jgi:cell division protein ZapA
MNGGDGITRVNVRLLDKEYPVACPPEQRAELLESAAYLNNTMREIRDGGKVVGTDRIAVMAALNLANELVRLKGKSQYLEGDVGVRLKHLRERVETALANGRQLEL